ncbi:MAG: hypothetical protein MJ193_01935, partial [Clostridia bacterium]|nr:hypothetical protein [Clostridia bacterium]
MKNKKLIVCLILIILVGIAGVAVGATASYWSDASAVTGVAPQAITYDYNAWKKYVTWQFVDNNQNWTLNNGVYVWNGAGTPSYNIEVTGFKDYLNEFFIVPEYIDAKVKVGGVESARNLKVTKVKSTIFADDSLKKMPTSLVIPAGVTVETAAFSGLTNLKELIFDG